MVGSAGADAGALATSVESLSSPRSSEDEVEQVGEDGCGDGERHGALAVTAPSEAQQEHPLHAARTIAKNIRTAGIVTTS